MIATGADDPNPSPDKRHRARLQQLYERGVQLLLGGADEQALDCFKQIYEVDYTFQDIAPIVEDSYVEHDWATKHREKLRLQNGG